MVENLDYARVPDRDAPTRKRDHPPLPVTEEVLERRRLSRQMVNSSQPKREGPLRKRGRPRRAMAKVILDPQSLKSCDSCFLSPRKHLYSSLQNSSCNTSQSAYKLSSSIPKSFLPSYGSNIVPPQYMEGPRTLFW